MRILLSGSVKDGFVAEGPFTNDELSLADPDALDVEYCHNEPHERLIEWAVNVKQEFAHDMYTALIKEGFIDDDDYMEGYVNCEAVDSGDQVQGSLEQDCVR